MNSVTSHPTPPAQPNAKTIWVSYRMSTLKKKVTVMDMNTVTTMERVPLAPTRLFNLRALSPWIPTRERVKAFFSSLKMRDMAAEAGTFTEPNMLSRIMLASTMVSRTYTTLVKQKRLGRQTLRWVTLTTLPESDVLTNTLTFVTNRTAPKEVVPVFIVEPRKPIVLPSILMTRLNTVSMKRKTTTYKQTALTNARTPPLFVKDGARGRRGTLHPPYPRHNPSLPAPK